MATQVLLEHAGDAANTPDATLCLVKKANSVSVDLLSRLRKSNSISSLKEPIFAKMGLKASHNGWILRWDLNPPLFCLDL